MMLVLNHRYLVNPLQIFGNYFASLEWPGSASANGSVVRTVYASLSLGEWRKIPADGLPCVGDEPPVNMME